MLEMLFGCGLRGSELAGLQVDDMQIGEDHWAIVDLIGKGEVGSKSKLAAEDDSVHRAEGTGLICLGVARTDIVPLRPGPSGETIKTRAAVRTCKNLDAGR